MQNRNNQGRSSISFIAGVILAILVTGGGAAWWAYRSLVGSSVPEIVPTQPEVVETPASPKPIPLEAKAEVYWLKSEGDPVEWVTSPVIGQKSANSDDILKTALTTLLAGPEDSQYATTIPEGTELLDFKVTKEGIYLNLSNAFTEGGGSAAMVGRLKQILFTATSIDSNQSVWLNIDGQPLEYLGGEGLTVAQPMNRQWFTQEYGE